MPPWVVRDRASIEDVDHLLALIHAEVYLSERQSGQRNEQGMRHEGKLSPDGSIIPA